MAVLGQDLAPIRDSVSGALASLRGATEAADQASPSFASVLRSVSQPPQSGLDAGLAPLYQVGYGAQAGGGFGGNAWQTLANAASAFGGGGGLNLDLSQAWQSIGSFGNYQAARAAAAVPDTRGPLQPGAAPSGAPSGAPGSPGQGWGAPTAQQLDEELAGSPLAGQGATIAAIAQRHGVPVTVAMGILRQESSYGRNATGNNYGGLMNADGSHTLAQFGSVAEGLDAVIGNMGTPLYRGKTIADFMNTYAPPSDGNDTNGYINNILTLDHKWGGHSDWGTVVTGAPQAATTAPRAGVTPRGYAFPVVGFQGPVQDHWGQERGGTDLMAPEGTPVVALGGGTVEDASPNSLGGNTVTLRLDDGTLVYMAHLRDAPLVRAGQRVNAGDALGFVGTTGNAAGGPAHLHIGVGNTIVSGGGPTGGLGAGLDAVALLQSILDGR